MLRRMPGTEVIAHSDGGARAVPPGRHREAVAADVLRIEPPRGLPALELKQLWTHRQLIVCLARQDLALRYRQTVAGVTWVVMRSFLSAVIFTIFFGHWLRMSSAGAPYMLFVFCGVVPWSYFVHVLTVSANSVVGQRALVTKVWFPRIILPVAPALAGLVDLGVSLAFLGGLMVYFRVVPHGAVLIPPGLLGV